MTRRNVGPHVPLCLALLCAMPALPALAQAPIQEPAAGARIRLQDQAGRSHEGSWIRRGKDSVYLAVVGPLRPDTLAIRQDAITRLERVVGTRSQAGKGALIGGGIGAGVNLLLGLALMGDENDWFALSGGEVALGTAMGGLVGAGIGALIGSASDAPVWERFELPPPVVPPNGMPHITLLRTSF